MMEIGWQDIRDLGYKNYDEYLYYCEEDDSYLDDIQIIEDADA